MHDSFINSFSSFNSRTLEIEKGSSEGSVNELVDAINYSSGNLELSHPCRRIHRLSWLSSFVYRRIYRPCRRIVVIGPSYGVVH